jgi:RNA polymerase sigma factor FliA
MRHQESATRPSRDAVILGQLYQVHIIAGHLKRRVPASVTMDDLISAGTIGLIQAVDRFDPSHGIKLKTFAERRIHGGMLDLLRREDPLSRSERRSVRTGKCEPVRIESLDQLSIEKQGSIPAANTPSPLEQAMTTDLERRVSAQRTKLSTTEQRVLSLRYEDGLTNVAIGLRLSLHESRVSQISFNAVRKLQQMLAPKDREGAA